MYAVDHNGEYPDSSNGDIYQILMQPEPIGDQQLEPYIHERSLDAWKQELIYEYPSTKFQINKPAIWSAGPNRRDDGGSEDDIKNWQDT